MTTWADHLPPPFSEETLGEYETHTSRIAERARARRDAVKLRSVAFDEEEREAVSASDLLGKWQPGDRFRGDVNMRTLNTLLGMVDEAGYERSAHQMRFHEAFHRSCARVLYKDDWSGKGAFFFGGVGGAGTGHLVSQENSVLTVFKPEIMKKYGWKKSNSEVLISTPRRFGKTFS